ncbi:hypothetical protein BO94DRAFT_455628, partial [Aspergillus sclerotioniger CBS 115572]
KFIKEWWKTSYDKYIIDNKFNEQDLINLFEIYYKYMPERDWLRQILFTEIFIYNNLERQYLKDILSLIIAHQVGSGITPLT